MPHSHKHTPTCTNTHSLAHRHAHTHTHTVVVRLSAVATDSSPTPSGAVGTSMSLTLTSASMTLLKHARERSDPPWTLLLWLLHNPAETTPRPRQRVIRPEGESGRRRYVCASIHRRACAPTRTPRPTHTPALHHRPHRLGQIHPAHPRTRRALLHPAGSPGVGLGLGLGLGLGVPAGRSSSVQGHSPLSHRSRPATSCAPAWCRCVCVWCLRCSWFQSVCVVFAECVSVVCLCVVQAVVVVFVACILCWRQDLYGVCSVCGPCMWFYSIVRACCVCVHHTTCTTP